MTADKTRIEKFQKEVLMAQTYFISNIISKDEYNRRVVQLKEKYNIKQEELGKLWRFI